MKTIEKIKQTIKLLKNSDRYEINDLRDFIVVSTLNWEDMAKFHRSFSQISPEENIHFNTVTHDTVPAYLLVLSKRKGIDYR